MKTDETLGEGRGGLDGASVWREDVGLRTDVQPRQQLKTYRPIVS